MNHLGVAESEQHPTPSTESKLELLSKDRKELMISHVTTSSTSIFQSRQGRSLSTEVAGLKQAANNDYGINDKDVNDSNSNPRPLVSRRASMPKIQSAWIFGEDNFSNEGRVALLQRFRRRASLPISFGGSEQQESATEVIVFICAQQSHMEHPITGRNLPAQVNSESVRPEIEQSIQTNCVEKNDAEPEAPQFLIENKRAAKTEIKQTNTLQGEADSGNESDSEILFKGRKIERTSSNDKEGTLSRLKQASALMGAIQPNKSTDKSSDTDGESGRKLSIGSISDHRDDHIHNNHRRRRRKKSDGQHMLGNDLLVKPKPTLTKVRSFEIFNDDDKAPPTRSTLKRASSDRVNLMSQHRRSLVDPGKLSQSSHRKCRQASSNDPGSRTSQHSLRRSNHGAKNHTLSSHRTLRRANSNDRLKPSSQHSDRPHSDDLGRRSHRRPSDDPGRRMHRRPSNDPGLQMHRRPSMDPGNHMHRRTGDEPVRRVYRRPSDEHGNRAHRRPSDDPGHRIHKQGSFERSDHSHRRGLTEPGSYRDAHSKEGRPKDDNQEHKIYHKPDGGHNLRSHDRVEGSHDFHEGDDGDSCSYFEESVVSTEDEEGKDTGHGEQSASPAILEEDTGGGEGTVIEVVSGDDSGSCGTSSYDSLGDDEEEEDESEYSTGSGYTIDANSLACESEVSFSQYCEDMEDNIYEANGDDDDDDSNYIDISYRSDSDMDSLSEHEPPAKPHHKQGIEPPIISSTQRSSLLGAPASHSHPKSPAALLYTNESDDED